jgi:hypothetical protein
MMLLFLAGLVEQLDLALEHIGKGNVHDARFGLMLTDNALELLLHQIVKDKQAEARSWHYHEQPYPYESQLRKAFLGSFSDKVAFARLEAGLGAPVARTFNILHDYRNDLYHAGLAHEEILQSLARMYFDTSCGFLTKYEPPGLGWSSRQELPDRAKKYFTGHQTLPGKHGDFAEACKTMAASNDFDAAELSSVLADDMERIAEYIDSCLQIVADGVYEGQKTTRDQAIVSTQAWDLAFTEEGKAFAAEHGFKGGVLHSVDFLVEKYPFECRRDPIPSWLSQSKKLRSKGDAHMALDHYQSFVTATGPLRAALEQSASAAEAEIDAAMDRWRGK